jgi:hypothetical protein
MVSGKCFYLKAAIAQLGQLAEETDIALGNYILILEPGIKEVAYEVEQACIGLYAIEPGAYAFFTLRYNFGVLSFLGKYLFFYVAECFWGLCYVFYYQV